jgi:hypothetical protein
LVLLTVTGAAASTVTPVTLSVEEMAVAG